MNGMTMPGGWPMSTVWVPLPGQTWTSAAASFVAMWDLMMAAMMLPSVAPALWRYGRTVRATSAARTGGLTALVAAGYLVVWTAVGMVVFPSGSALATVVTRYPRVAGAAPTLAGVVVLIAGALQFSAWKARHLACWREGPGRGSHLPDASSAWRHGMRLGVDCVLCSAGLAAALLAVGVMDLRAMAVVAVMVTAERLAPRGDRVARGAGAVAVAVGLLLVARAAGLG